MQVVLDLNSQTRVRNNLGGRNLLSEPDLRHVKKDDRHGEKSNLIVINLVKILSRSKPLPCITKKQIFVHTPGQLHATNLTENQAKK